MKLYRYDVQGIGEFPTDMLRYDQATIISQEDRLASNVRGYKTVYTLEGKTAPTVGRWNSFLWSVSNVRRV